MAFYNKRRKLPHTDKHLHLSNSVAITFHLQKRSTKLGETIIMHRTRDANLNPVVHWDFNVRRVMHIPNWQPTWPIITIQQNGITDHIKSKEISDLIKTTVKDIGPDILGFTHNNVNTHSNRAAAAIAMYLENVPVYTIMLVGR